MTPRTYKAPPIIDAFIELKFGDTITEAVRGKVSEKFAVEYPIVEELLQQQIMVEMATGGIQAEAEVIDRMVKRSSTDLPNYVQIGTDTLLVCSSAPYSGWDDISARLMSHWALAKKSWGFRPIVRIGVRFVNRIDLAPDENGTVQYEEFLNLRINLPEAFPHINGYGLTFEIALRDISCSARVQSGVVPPAVPGKYSFTLDVDVSRSVDVPQKEREVQLLLNKMREAKNFLFETFITDKARMIFDAH